MDSNPELLAMAKQAADATVPEDSDLTEAEYTSQWYTARDGALAALEALTGGKTRLIIAESDKPLAFLELDDEALGRFCRSYLIAIERAVRKSAGDREMPEALAMSMHGAIALYRIAVEANAEKYELKQEGVTWGGKLQGDWTLTVKRTALPSTTPAGAVG